MAHPAPTRSSPLQEFLRSEAAGGIILIAAAALALIVANSPLADAYFHALHARLGPLSLHHWINDELMALFFLLVGLEIKREFVDGDLARPSDRILPILAAAGGMAAPAAIYLLIAGARPGLGQGWAIPAATDIAFAIGVLALLGPRVPTSLKLFLTTISIADDLGAVAIIALFYTASLNFAALGAAAVILVALHALNRRRVSALWPYLLLSLGLWLAVLLSGVHATVAGVLAAFAIPIRAPSDGGTSPLHRLEHGLHPWVAFGVVPLFGFANAGVSFAGMGLAQLLAPLPLAVALGLFLGKQIGIFASVRAAVGLGIAQRPTGASWTQIYGVALLCGIGFTMSLFIGSLAFRDPLLVDEVKIGVLGGSLLSAVAGYVLLSFAASHPPPKGEGDRA